MTQAITLLLSLAGAACATYSLMRGDGLRGENDRLAQRFTPGVLLALVLLACAVVGSTVLALQASASAVGLAWMVSVLLAAAAGSQILAVVAAPVRRGDETIGDRFTSHGKLALGLLTSAVGLSLASGPGAAIVSRLEDLSDMATPTLVALGLCLATLGTIALAGLLRSGRVFLPGEGPRLMRLSPQARAAGVLLALSLEFVGLAAWTAPQSIAVVALVLLIMGVIAGLRGLSVNGKTMAHRTARLLGVPFQGQVALGLMTAASIILAVQLFRPVIDAERSLTSQAGQLNAGSAKATNRSETMEWSPWQKKREQGLNYKVEVRDLGNGGASQSTTDLSPR